MIGDTGGGATLSVIVLVVALALSIVQIAFLGARLTPAGKERK